ncbi:hypothetical protein DPMN_004443 [Dreissena polymorpha]|uniref:Uncharacterized protein n=1 Tax=Dreissena polymorpha TaxID=45954 RepID=A0A9D4MSN6_DREPO|nr:hypothetical protein DPMN_004443 [Dreissena polymorpha]
MLSIRAQQRVIMKGQGGGLWKGQRGAKLPGKGSVALNCLERGRVALQKRASELQIRICEISNSTATDRKKRSYAENQLVPVLPYPK